MRFAGPYFARIKAGSVEASHIAAGAITTDKLATIDLLGNWDGNDPLDLSAGFDAIATTGYAFDGSEGRGQIMDTLYVGGNVELIAGGSIIFGTDGAINAVTGEIRVEGNGLLALGGAGVGWHGQVTNSWSAGGSGTFDVFGQWFSDETAASPNWRLQWQGNDTAGGGGPIPDGLGGGGGTWYDVIVADVTDGDEGAPILRLYGQGNQRIVLDSNGITALGDLDLAGNLLYLDRGDPDTYITRVGANAVDVITGGAARLSITTGGISTTQNISWGSGWGGTLVTEIGPTGLGAAAATILDFHTGFNNDRDARLTISGGSSGVNNSAAVDLAAAAFTFSGNTIWHAGNDGAGSGLHADLLDGYHGTSYVRFGQAHTGHYGGLTGSSPNLVYGTTSTWLLSSSDPTHKADIVAFRDRRHHNPVLELTPIWFRSLFAADDSRRRRAGYSAFDVREHFPHAYRLTISPDGEELHGYDLGMIVAGLHDVVESHERELADVRQELAALRSAA